MLLTPALVAATAPDQILLKDYQPRSIYKIPQTRVEKARYPVIDVHTHVYATNDVQVEGWVKTMDDVGLQKSIILSGSTGEKYDAVAVRFGRYPERFDVWCGIDFTGIDQPDFGSKAIAELERCHKAGAKGVGELSDKGRGLSRTNGMHCDDPRMDPIFEKCADLGMRVNIHIGEDQWMYEPMDEHNDGLMNGYTWRIPPDPAVLTHPQVLATLDRAVGKHPRTTFIACHLANCCADLSRLGELLDKYPNLNADIGARFSELTSIPRFVNRFMTKYQDRILYGTDNTPVPEMYRTSFRILETDDEHFYPVHFSKYHWPQSAFALPDQVLKKIYHDNAVKLTQGEKP
ncbi:MAG: putative metal-dependent hydrolase, TIM-barrel fold [Verrucomicrobiales bacterium]|nr:putative metal-dependent hydrolase, TIM-barrel fold [Verrucomicrobiales bacterium]